MQLILDFYMQYNSYVNFILHFTGVVSHLRGPNEGRREGGREVKKRLIINRGANGDL